MKLFKRIVILMLIFVLLLNNAASIVFAVQNDMNSDMQANKNESNKSEEDEGNSQENAQNEIREPQSASSSEDEQELTSEKYVVDELNLLIKRILPETEIVNFKAKFNVPSNNVKVYEDTSCTKEVTSGLVKTRMAVKVLNSSKVYTICVIGDLNDDGKMGEIELNRIIKHVVGLKKFKLQGLDEICADINGDGKIDQIDITILIRWIVYRELNIPEVKMPDAPIIEVIEGEEKTEGVYASDVTVRIKEGKNEQVKVLKTVYSINYGEEIEIKDGGTIILTKDGEYKIIAYTYSEEGARSRTAKTIKIEREEEKEEAITKEDVNISKSEENWTNKDVILGVDINDKIDKDALGLEIEYSIDGGKTYKAYDEVKKIAIKENGKIEIKITDKYGRELKLEEEVNNIDKVLPEVTVTEESKTVNSIEVSVKGEDELSGIEEGAKYKYYIKKSTETEYPNTPNHEGTNTTYKFENLEENTEYDIKVTIEDIAGNEGIGKLEKIKTEKEEIIENKKDISELEISLDKYEYTYDGTAKEPTVTIKDGSKVLSKEADYTVEYKNNVNAGTAEVKITAKEGSNYEGTVTKTFIIINAENEVTVIGKTGLTYTGKAQKIVSVLNKAGEQEVYYSTNKVLTANNYETEGSLSIPEAVDAGNYTVYYYVEGNGNYNIKSGSTAVVIAKKEVAVEWGEAELEYTGEAQAPTAVVESGIEGEIITLSITGKETNIGTDYTAVASIESVEGGQANKNNYTLLESSIKFNIVEKGANTFTVTLSREEYTYDGTAKTPTVTVKDGSKLLTEDTDYTVEYRNNVNAGEAEAVITGKGTYSGRESKVFTINKRTLEVKANNKTKIYGEENPELDYTYSGEVTGEIPLFTGSLETMAQKDSSIGTYDIDIGNLSLENNGSFLVNNYEIVYTKGILTITTEDASGLEVTLSQSSYTYDGTAKEPEVTVKEGGTVLTKGTDYTVEYKNNVNAGVAEVVITGKGAYSGIVSKTFTIIKAENETTITGKTGLIYTGSAQKLTTVESEQKVYYSTDGILTANNYETEGSINIPEEISAGNYTVYYYVEGDSNHNAKNGSIVVTISKKVVTVEWGEAELEYNGKAQAPTAVVESGIEGETIVLNITGRKTNVGTDYTAVASIIEVEGGQANKDNYELIGTTKQYSIIGKNASTLTVTLSKEEYTYDGTAKEPIVTVKDENTLLSKDIHYTVEYRNNVNAGEAEAVITGKGAYSGSTTKNFTINKRTLEVKANAKIKIYGEENPELDYTYSGEVTGEIPLFTGGLETMAEKDSSIGTYDITKGTLALADNENFLANNYVISYTKGVLTITTKDASNLEVTLSQDSYTYDGTAKQPEVTVKEGETVLTKGTDYIVEYKNNVNVGVAEVVITGKGAYSGVVSKTFTITKAEDKVTIAGKTGLEYTGKAQKLITVVNVGEGEEIYYSTNKVLTANNYETEGNINVPETVNAGNYIVYYYIVGDNNHAARSGSIVVAIAKREVTVKWGGTELEYNGKAQAPTAVAESGIEGETINLSITGKQINVGTEYTAIANIEKVEGGQANKDNYELIQGTKKYSIVNKDTNEFTVTLSKEEYTYDGTEKEPEVTVQEGETVLTKGTDYTVEYKNNVNAGIGEVVITGKGGYSGSTTKNITINKRTLEIKANSKTKIYGEENPELDYTYSGEVTGEIPLFTGSLETMAKKDSSIGTYDITKGTLALVDNGSFLVNNYRIEYTKGVLTITTEEASKLEVTLSQNSYTYDGMPKEPEVTVKEGEKVLTKDTDYTVKYKNNVNAGEAEVVITGKGTYSGVISTTFTINKADPQVIVIGEVILEYTGKEQKLVSVLGGNKNVYYSINKVLTLGNYKTEGSTSEPKAIDAGNYTVYYYVEGDSNYNAKSGSTSVNIPKKVVIAEWGEAELEYNGTAQAPTVVAESGIEGETIKLNVTGKQTNVGANYTAVASIIEVEGGQANKNNYELLQTTRKYSIVRKDTNEFTVTLSKEEYTYDGKAKEPIVTVKDGAILLSKDTHYTVEYRNNVNAGEAEVVVEGKGAYSGAVSKAFIINKRTLEVKANAKTIIYGEGIPELDYTYSGEVTGETPEFTGKLATSATASSALGTYDITKGTLGLADNGDFLANNYEMEYTKGVLTITIKDASKLEVTLSQNSYTYDGTAKKPEVTVKEGETVLTKDTDYTVEYKNNVNAGIGEVVITGKGAYSGVVSKTFTITKAENDVTVSGKTGLEYTGKAQKVVTAGTTQKVYYSTNKILTANNYETEGSINIPEVINAGDYRVYYYVEGDSNHNAKSGSIVVNLSKKNVAVTWGETELEYTGTAQAPTALAESGIAGETIVLNITGKQTNVGTDYTAVASIASVEGGQANKNNYELTETTKKYSIVSKNVSTFTVTLDKEEYTYDGTAKEPGVTVKDGSKLLTKNTHYTVEYKNNVNAGTAEAVITGKGGYSGSTTRYFTINKRTLEVKANAKTIVYGEEIPELDYTYSGEVTGETPEFTGKLATSATASSSLGTYDITKGTLALANNENFLAKNYEMAYTKASLTITTEDASNLEVTLSTEEFTYDGTAKEPGVTVKEGGTVLTKGTDYTVEYKNNVNAGEAEVVITGKGTYSGVVSKTFTINKAEINARITGKTGLEYTGKAQELVTIENAKDNVNIYYSINKALTAGNYSTVGSTNIPELINAGEYTVYYYAVIDENYNTKSGSTTVSISKKTVTLEWGETELEYTGKAQAPTVIAKSGVEGETIVLNITGQQTNVGTDYTATASILSITGGQANKDNYELMQTTIIYSIVGKDTNNFIVTLSKEEYNYDGNAKTPTVTVKDGTTLLSKDTHYTVEYKNNVNAGEAEVVITGKGAYKGTITKTFTINKVTATNPSLKGVNVTYDGNLHEVEVTGGVGGTICYRTSEDGISFENWDEEKPGLTNVGKMYVQAYVKGDNNHNDTEVTASVAITINKRTLNVIANNKTKEYGEENPELDYTYNGEVEEEFPAFEGSLETTATTTSEAGEYDITIGSLRIIDNIVDDSKVGKSFIANNYEVVYTKGKLTIEKVEIGKDTLSLEDVVATYDGTAHEIEVNVEESVLGTGTIYYRTSTNGTTFGSWSTTKPSLTNVGKIYVQAYIKGNGNYEGTEPTEISTIEITKREFIITAKPKTKSYGEANPKFDYTYNGEVEGEKPLFTGKLTTQATVSSNVGQYDIEQGTLKIANNGSFKVDNYNVIYNKASLTIVNKEASKLEISLSQSSYEYDGTAKEPEVTVKDGETTLVEGTDYVVEYLDNMNAGTATVKVTLKEGTNYTGIATKTFKITKADSTAPVLTNVTVTYDGKPHEIEVSGAEGGTVYYRTGTTVNNYGEWTEEKPSLTNAGKLYVQAYVQGDSNHSNTTATLSAVIQINKRTLNVVANAKEKEYGDMNPELDYTYSGEVEGETPKFTGTLYTKATTSSYAGEYEITKGTLELVDNVIDGGGFLASNYSMEFTNSTLTIVNKVSTNFTVILRNDTFIYDGQEKTPLVTVKDGNTLLAKDIHYTVEYKDNINAGIGTVIIKGIGNYSGTIERHFVISALDLINPSLSSVKEVYDGKPHEIVATGGVITGGTVYYRTSTNGTEFSDWTEEKPSLTNAGKLYVQAYVKGDINHNDTEPTEIATIQIDPKEIIVTAEAKTREYGDKNPEFTYTYRGEVEGETPKFTGELGTTAEVNSNVGTYDITIGSLELVDNGTFLANNYTLSFIKAELTITVKNTSDLEVTITPESYIYDGTAKEPTVTIKDGELTLVEGTDYTVEYTDNVNAGIATITIEGKGNYQDEIIKNFIIHKAENTITVVAKTGLTYNGKEQNLITVSANQGEVYYSTNKVLTASNYGTDGSLSMPSAIDAGSYTVYYYTPGDDNYNAKSGSAVVVIAKKQVTVTWTAQTEFVYNSEEQAPTASVESGVEGETINLKLSGGQIEVGTDYTAVVSIESVTGGQANKDNYELIGTTKKFSIVNKNASTLTVTLSPSSYTYDGTAKEPEVTVKDGETVLTENADYVVEYTNNINAGTGVVTIRGINNYAGSKTVNFTIEKAESTNPSLTEVKATYDGAAHEIGVSGGAGGTIYYRTSTDGTTFGSWSKTKPSLTNVGKVYVQAYVKGDNNHNDTAETESTAITINKRTLNVIANAKTKVYGDLNPELDYTYNGEVIGETPGFTGKLETTATTSSEIGTYDITIGTLALANNGAFLANNYTINYTKASLTITIKSIDNLKVTLSPSSYTYDGTAKEPTATVKDGSTTLTLNTDYEVSYSNNINAGTATATITFKGNYKGTKEINFTISKAESTNPSLTAVNVTYDGAAHEIGVSGGAGGTIYYRTSTNGTTFGGWSTTKPSLTNAGKLYVQAYVKGDSNHNNTAATGSVAITVNKRTLNVKANAKSKVYGELNPELDYTYSGEVSGQTPKFTGELETTATTNSLEGTYDITIGTLALADNGTFLASNYVISYTKASLTVIGKNISELTVTLNPTSYTYDGTAKKPTVTVKDGNTTLTLNTDYTVSYRNNTNAGTAIVTITGAGNYSGTREETFIINKAANPISVVGKTGLIETGSSQQLVTVTNAQGTVYFSTSTVLTSSNYTSGSTSIPTGTAAGNYTVYYYTPGNNNYAEKSGQVSATILRGIAKIGSTIYQSIQLAVDAVPTNNVQTTITMLQSTTESANIPANKNVILDLANYTVTGDESNPTITSSGTLTVKGGTLTSANNSTIQNAGTLNIIDTANIGNDSGGSDYASIYATEGAITTISGGTLTEAARIITNYGALNITGGTVTSAKSGYTAIFNYGTLNMSGGTIQVEKTMAIWNEGTLNISGTANIAFTDSERNGVEAGFIGNSTNGIMTISGGTITADYGHIIRNHGMLTVTGGIIKTTEFGQAVLNNGTLEISGTANMGGVNYYTSYETSIINMTGGTVNSICTGKKTIATITGGTITNDITNQGTLNVSGTANITSDHCVIYNKAEATATITGGTIKASGADTIQNYGTLEIGGTANITNTASSGIAISNYTDAILNISGGTITSEKGTTISNSGTATITGGTVSSAYISNHTVINKGTLEIGNSANIINTATGDVMSTAGVVYNAQGATSNIIGGTITSTNIRAIYNDGTATITGGTITSKKRSAIYNSAKLTISGGTITSDTSTIFNHGTLDISDTAYIATNGSNDAIYNCEEATTNISGGTIINQSTTGGQAITNSGILNISNKANIISTSQADMIRNSESGILTISGVTITAENSYAILNYGMLEIKNGAKIISNAPLKNGNTCSSTIRSAGTTIVSGGTITSKNGIAIDNEGKLEISGTANITTTSTVNFSAVYNDESATANISGGTITSTSNAVHNNGTLNVSGTAKIETTSTDKYSLFNTGTATITGGTITSENSDTIESTGTLNISDNANIVCKKKNGTAIRFQSVYGVLNMSGGTVTSLGSYCIWIYEAKSITITGGTIDGSSASYAIYKDYSCTATVSISGATIIGNRYGV